MDIKQTILQKIKEAKMKPLPAWHFWWGRYGLWVLSGLLLLFGAFGVSSIFYIVTKNDWDIYGELNESRLIHLFETLPYVWLAIFIIMLVLLYIDIRHTKRGYTYTSLPLILAAFGASLLLGLGLHFLGTGQKIDTFIMNTNPDHASMFNPRLKALSRPEKGILTGKITVIETVSPTTTRVYVENPLLEGRWILIVNDSTVLPQTGIHIEDRIRALGEQVEEQQFIAHIILPFNKMGIEPGWHRREMDRSLPPIEMK